MLTPNMKEIIPLHSCSSFFNLPDMLGINVVGFLHSSTSYAGVLVSSSTPRGRSHCRGCVFSTHSIIYHSHMLCQTVFHMLCQIEVFWDNNNLAWRCLKKSHREGELESNAIILTKDKGCLTHGNQNWKFNWSFSAAITKLVMICLLHYFSTFCFNKHPGGKLSMSILYQLHSIFFLIWQLKAKRKKDRCDVYYDKVHFLSKKKMNFSMDQWLYDMSTIY